MYHMESPAEEVEGMPSVDEVARVIWSERPEYLMLNVEE